MSKRNALFILTLSALLFAFAAGVLVSRPVTAQAQALVGYPGMPMRQADLWSYSSPSPDSFGSFPTAGGGTFYGYGFTVQPDAAGRLPVLTNVLLFDNGPTGLYRRGIDGMYRMITSRETQRGPTDLSPGFVLQPGDYALSYVNAWPTIDAPVVLVGYWARP